MPQKIDNIIIIDFFVDCIFITFENEVKTLLRLQIKLSFFLNVLLCITYSAEDIKWLFVRELNLPTVWPEKNHQMSVKVA